MKMGEIIKNTIVDGENPIIQLLASMGCDLTVVCTSIYDVSILCLAFVGAILTIAILFYFIKSIITAIVSIGRCR